MSKQRRTQIQHAVWPTGVPSVCTALWGQDGWDRFAERFRPEDYTGGMHDQAAWDAHEQKRSVLMHCVVRLDAEGRTVETCLRWTADHSAAMAVSGDLSSRLLQPANHGGYEVVSERRKPCTR